MKEGRNKGRKGVRAGGPGWGKGGPERHLASLKRPTLCAVGSASIARAFPRFSPSFVILAFVRVRPILSALSATMFTFVAILASLVSASAFAPAARVASSSALRMSFEDAIGAQRESHFRIDLLEVQECKLTNLSSCLSHSPSGFLGSSRPPEGCR